MFSRFRVMAHPGRGLPGMTHQATLETRPRSVTARVRSWFFRTGAAPARVVARPAPAIMRRPDPVAALGRAWRGESLVTGWRNPADWWDPACEATVESLLSRGPDLKAALARLGRVRAELGCTIEETLDDLAALFVVAGAGDPPVDAVRALVGGWVESGLRQVGTASCFDPVSGLATRAYLQARLTELYRDSRPGHPADTLCLVVVDLEIPGALEGLPALHRVAEALRRSFTQGCTLARVGPGRFLAVATVGPALPGHLTMLEGLLSDPEDPGAGTAAAVWVESLPRTHGLVHGLLDDLVR